MLTCNPNGFHPPRFLTDFLTTQLHKAYLQQLMYDTFTSSFPCPRRKVYYASTADSNGNGNEFVMCIFVIYIIFCHFVVVSTHEISWRCVSLYFIVVIAYYAAERQITKVHALTFANIDNQETQTMEKNCFVFFLSLYFDSLSLSSIFSPSRPIYYSMKACKVHETKVKCHTFIINYFVFIPRHGNFAF